LSILILYLISFYLIWFTCCCTIYNYVISYTTIIVWDFPNGEFSIAFFVGNDITDNPVTCYVCVSSLVHVHI